jgi:hypothetical protein
MKYYLFIVSLVLNFSVKATGTWPIATKQGYFQLSFYTIPAVGRLHLSPYKTRFLHRKVFDFTLQAYAAYGINKRWTLSLTLPLKYVSSGQPILSPSFISATDELPPKDTADAGFLVDLGNVAFSCQYLFFRNRSWVLSVHLSTAFPTAIQAYNKATSLRTAYPCLSIYPRITAGYSTQKLYSSMGTGLQLRSHNYAHQWMFDYEIGWRIGQKCWVAVQVSTVYCLAGKPDLPRSMQSIQTGLYINNQNYVALTIKTIVEIKPKWGLQLSLGGGLWANNVQQGPSLGIGLYYKTAS